MTVVKRNTHGGLNGLLGSEQVRRVQQEGKILFAAVDVVAALTNGRQPERVWADLKTREPGLAGVASQVAFTPEVEGGEPLVLDAVDVEGVLRLVQSVPTARAERVRKWLAATARERLEEEKNP